ncbi:MAG: LysR substrate-binding domain-containing protein [Gemmatimonadaceae bacterium]
MELRHLRYFVAVAEELHFGRAAARIHIAQPALSQQIQQLERELGVVLLARSKRRVALTEPGRAFLGEARRTLAAAETAMNAARQAALGEIGSLSVGYVDLATWLVFPAILRKYRERYPTVHVTLTQLHREPQRDALLRGDLDVGFFSLREHDRGLTGERVALDPLVVALPSGHSAARRSRVPLALLAGEPWVLFPSDLKTSYVDLVLASCRAAGFEPRVAQEASQLQTLAGLVSAGVGVTLLPSSVAGAPRAGLVTRPLSGRAPKLPLHLIWRTGDLPPTAAQFLATARALTHNEARHGMASRASRNLRRG